MGWGSQIGPVVVGRCTERVYFVIVLAATGNRITRISGASSLSVFIAMRAFDRSSRVVSLV